MWFDFQLVETYPRSSLSTNPPKGLCKADIEGGSIGVELVGGFNFRPGTYNVPPGSSAPSLKRPKAWRARSASLMGPVKAGRRSGRRVSNYRRFFDLENVLSPGGTLQSRARKGSNCFYLCFFV